MTLDNYIEGTFDPNNPANQETIADEFYSEDLNDCLNYAKDTEDFEPLENAIFLHEKRISKALEKVMFSLDAMAHSDNQFIINQLLAIKRELL